MAHTVLFLLLAVLLAGGALAGFEPTLSPGLVNEALGIGQSAMDSVRTRFHQPYRLQVARPPIDYVDIVTPFRRVVLITEERSRLGIRGFTALEATTTLGAQATVVEVRVEMTFHPQNTFVGVPAYDVELVPRPDGARVPPRNVDLIPRFGARVDGALPSTGGAPFRPGTSGPLTGGTIAAGFAVATLNGAGTYDVVVSEKGKELARAPVNFASLK